MSKEKQIEEMAKDLCDIECKGMKCNTCDTYGCEYRMQAEALYNAGYRKQSEPISCGHEKGGEWIYEYTGDCLDGTDAGYDYKCSVCGKFAVECSDYCPNCGAKMKGNK